MANPKYIKLPEEDEDKTDKKVTKKAYSFRCDIHLLEDMTKYADMEGVGLPQLLNDMMADFLKDKTLTNTYLPEYEGRYINIPSNVDGMYHKQFEYELRYVPNNLDVWDDGFISKAAETSDILHEGLDFLIIPETVHLSKVPEHEMGGIGYAMDMTKISSCLYCMYITVKKDGTVEYDVISWIDAMNKLKEVDRYDLISRANYIKKTLNKLHDEYLTSIPYDDPDMIAYNIYGRLLKIANDNNTGAILPASKSIDKIEYAPIVERLPDTYEIINHLMKENIKLKGMEKELNDIKLIIDKIDDEECRKEAWEDFKKGGHPESDNISDNQDVE